MKSNGLHQPFQTVPAKSAEKWAPFNRPLTRRYALYFLLAFISFIVTEELSTAIIFIALLLSGTAITAIFNKSPHRKKVTNIYEYSFIAYFVYALFCFIYMKLNGFQYLQSFDAYEIYIPYTTQLIETTSFVDLLSTIYSRSAYTFVGAILVVFVYISKLSIFLGGVNLYLPIQFSIMFFTAFVPVVIYRLFRINGITEARAYKYTMIYSLLSVHFMMATYIVRDMPITLCYTLLIYLTFKDFSLKNIFLMLLLILLVSSIRIASGLFAVLYIFLMIVLRQHDQRKKIFNSTSSYIVLLVMISTIFVFRDSILSTLDTTISTYKSLEEAAQDGESTKMAFEALPPGISHFTKVIYNQIMPIPCWRRMTQTAFRPECYNIMNFPETYATLFRYIMWAFILMGFFLKKTRAIILKNKTIFFNILAGLLFLMLQSMTMGHRRKLGVYPIFFLLSCLIYENIGLRDRRTILSLSIGIFTFFQLVGLIYLF